VTDPALDRILGAIAAVSSQHRPIALGWATVDLDRAAAELATELGLRKIVAQMTVDQKGAIATFERLGFRAEALLSDFVIDREGRMRDLMIMAYDVDGLTEHLD